MANHKSALKAHRQNVKARSHNRELRSRLRRALKTTRASIEGADKTVTLLAEVPGLCDEIEIDFSNNILVIHGPRKFLKSIKMKQKLELLDYKCINGILNINFKKIV